MSDELTKYKYDVFISYNPNDENWVKNELVSRFEEESISYIYELNFEPGHPILTEVERAISESRRTVMVLTPSYIESNWQDFASLLAGSYGLEIGEWTAIPVIKETCELPLRFRGVVTLDLSESNEEEWRRLLRTLSSRPVVSPRIDHGIGHSARKGIHALIDLMQTSAVRDAVVTFRTDFQAACEQIDVLSDYKRLHDLFHHLEQEIIRIQSQGPVDDAALPDLIGEIPTIQHLIKALLSVARRASFAADTVSWMKRLEQVREKLQLVLDELDIKPLKSASNSLSRVLANEPSKINDRLVATARVLRLEALVEDLTAVQTSLDAPGLDETAVRQVEAFKEGVKALNELEQSLTLHVNYHDTLQRMDEELRWIKANWSQNVEELREDGWPELKSLMQTLQNSSEVDWANGLCEVGDRLETAISAEDPRKVRVLFELYRRQAGNSFYQIDRDLLALCGELQKVGEPLAAVLKTIGGG